VYDSGFVDSTYCPTGFTLAFWIRLIRTDSTSFDIIHQSFSNRRGIKILVRSGSLNLLLKTDKFRYQYIGPSTFLDKASRAWTFLAITYDPTSTKKLYAAVDAEYIDEFTTVSVNQVTPRVFSFGVNTGEMFMLDDIVFIPKSSTEQELSAIYNSSKFVLLYEFQMALLSFIKRKRVPRLQKCFLSFMITCNVLPILVFIYFS